MVGHTDYDPIEAARLAVQSDGNMTIYKRFPFEAAHQLPYHEGKCKNPHGHSYVLEIGVTGLVQPDEPDNPQSGMVLDFGDVSAAVKPVIALYLDHHDLNDILVNPTAERILYFIVEMIRPRLGFWLSVARLWETATSYAEWKR